MEYRNNKNNITSDAKDITVLGLKSRNQVANGRTITSTSERNYIGRMLWITHYLNWMATLI
jgi:hypothetical protein